MVWHQQMKYLLTLGTGAFTSVDFCNVSFSLKVCPPEDVWDSSLMALQEGWLLLFCGSNFHDFIPNHCLDSCTEFDNRNTLLKIHSLFPQEQNDAKQRVKPIQCFTAFMEQHCLNSVWLDYSCGVFWLYENSLLKNWRSLHKKCWICSSGWLVCCKLHKKSCKIGRQAK